MGILDIDDLEFTIHRMDEMEISTVETKNLRQDDTIQTALLQHAQSSSRSSSSRGESQDSQDSNSLTDQTSEDDQEDYLVKMSYNLAERDEEIGENNLLQDLKFLKEEAWAIRKARRLRKLKKVQFEDLQPVQFQRKCCSYSNKNRKTGINENNKNSSHNHHSHSHESFVIKGNGVGDKTSPKNMSVPDKTVKISSQTETKNTARPVATLHSINMFGSIIPSYLLPVSNNHQFRASPASPSHNITCFIPNLTKIKLP